MAGCVQYVQVHLTDGEHVAVGQLVVGGGCVEHVPEHPVIRVQVTRATGRVADLPHRREVVVVSTAPCSWESAVWVAPKLRAHCRFLSSMSTAMIVLAPATDDPAMAALPTPPQPMTATECHGSRHRC